MGQVNVCFLLLFHRSVIIIIHQTLFAEHLKSKTTGFAWTYLFVAFVKIGSASALTSMLYCSSVCEETSALSVHCREPAESCISAAHGVYGKKAHKHFQFEYFHFEKYNTTMSVTPQFFSFSCGGQKVLSAAKILVFFPLCSVASNFYQGIIKSCTEVIYQKLLCFVILCGFYYIPTSYSTKRFQMNLFSST